MRGSCIRVLDYRIRPLKLYEDSGRIPTTRTSGVLTKQPRPRKCKIFSESQVLSGRYALFSLQPTRYAFPTIWDQANDSPSDCCLRAFIHLVSDRPIVFLFCSSSPHCGTSENRVSCGVAATSRNISIIVCSHPLDLSLKLDCVCLIWRKHSGSQCLLFSIDR